MAKTWVLETQTKGTGATMVPLERVLRKPGAGAVEGFVLPALKPRVPEAETPGPRLFKVVDVMTRRVLGQNLAARAAVIVLERVERIVDVTVYVWEPSSERWRMHRFGETKALWEYRGRLPVEDDPDNSHG